MPNPSRLVAALAVTLLVPVASLATDAPATPAPDVAAEASPASTPGDALTSVGRIMRPAMVGLAHGHMHHHGIVQPDVPITVEALRDGIHMLTGQGGNIGIFVGSDGTFMIDDQFAALSERIDAAIKEIDDSAIRYLVNTHYHFDHTEGNENFGRAGATIVAHDNVRTRLAAGHVIEAFNRTMEPAPSIALPVLTFDGSMTFHWNGDSVTLYSVPPAHTDGDCFVHFERADVIHAGDLYFNGFWPFIDASAGGHIDGMIAAVNRVLEFTGTETIIMPGHGPVSNREELLAYRNVLETAAAAIRPLVAAGMSDEEIVAARPVAALDAEWGDGFLPTDAWVGIVADGMRRHGGVGGD